MTALTDIKDESRKIVEQVIYGARLLEQKHKETLQILGNALRQKVELKEKIEEIKKECEEYKNKLKEFDKLKDMNEELNKKIEEWKKKYENKIFHNE